MRVYRTFFPNLKLALLTGSLKAAEKREVLETIAKGEADLIIGTHALIQDGVEYARLGLIIIDEQHRFGVGQRRILREKATIRCPHDDGDSHSTDACHHSLWRYGCFHYRPDASRSEAYCDALDQT